MQDEVLLTPDGVRVAWEIVIGTVRTSAPGTAVSADEVFTQTLARMFALKANLRADGVTVGLEGNRWLATLDEIGCIRARRT